MKKNSLLVLLLSVALLFAACADVTTTTAPHNEKGETSDVQSPVPEEVTAPEVAAPEVMTPAGNSVTKVATENTQSSSEAEAQELTEVIIGSMSSVYSSTGDGAKVIMALNELYNYWWTLNEYSDDKIVAKEFAKVRDDLYDEYDDLKSTTGSIASTIKDLYDAMSAKSEIIDPLIPEAIPLIKGCVDTYSPLYDLTNDCRSTFSEYKADYADAFNDFVKAYNALGRYLYTHGHISRAEYKVIEIVDKPVVDETNEKFSEVIVVDNKYCLIKLTGVDSSDTNRCKVKVYYENKSSNMDMRFSLDNVSVNGLICDGYSFQKVSAKKKAIDEIEIDTSILTENGVKKFTDIGVFFKVYNLDDYSTIIDVDECSAHVYPYGEESASIFVRKTSKSDVLIADNEYITAYVVKSYSNKYYACILDVFLENKTDTSICFHDDNESINGYMKYSPFVEDIPAHSCAFASIKWDVDDLEDIGVANIHDVETIEFDFLAGERYSGLKKYADTPVKLSIK